MIRNISHATLVHNVQGLHGLSEVMPRWIIDLYTHRWRNLVRQFFGNPAQTMTKHCKTLDFDTRFSGQSGKYVWYIIKSCLINQLKNKVALFTTAQHDIAIAAWDTACRTNACHAISLARAALPVLAERSGDPDFCLAKSD